MLILLERIIKNVSKVYLPVYLIEAIFKIILLFLPDNDILIMVHAIWIMLSATFLIFYSMYDLYSFIYTRKYFFLYSTKYKIQTVFFIYVALYVLLNMLFYLMYSSFNIDQLLTKFLSILSFYLVNAVVLLFSKSIFRKEMGAKIYSIAIGLIIILVPAIYIFTLYNDYQVFIGAGNYVEQQVYALIVPLTVIGNDVAENISFYPMLSNIFFGSVSIISLLFIKNMKKNW